MQRNAGFTLIELAVTIGIAAILATIAVPAYNHFVSGNRVADAVNELAATLALARSEAITRGEQVSVCPSANALAGTPACDSGSWRQGWIVFTDEDADGAYDAGETLLRRHGALDDRLLVSSSGTKAYIAFNRMGFAQPTFNSSTEAPLTVVACPPDRRAANARALSLALSGEVTTTARKSDGSFLSCSS